MPKAVVLLCALAAASCGPDMHVPWTDLGTLKSGADAEVAYSMRAESDRNLCITVPTGRATAGTQLMLATCGELATQRWARYGGQLHGDGGLCMQPQGGKDREQAPVVLGPCTDEAASTWTLLPAHMQFGTRCVAIAGGKAVAGAALVLSPCADGKAEMAFVVSPMGSAKQPAPAQPASTKPAAPKPATPAPQAPAKQQPAKATPDAPAASGAFVASPAGTMLAPYFMPWGSTVGFIPTLGDAMAKGGVKAATFAFGLSTGSGCGVAGFADSKDDILQFKKNGGTVILSFGGALGTYLQKTCRDPQQLADAIDGQMATFNTRLIDFDVEGDNLNDAASNAALVDGLVLLQKKVPKAVISFTLPVDPESGLPQNALALVKLAAQKGLKLGRVNIMAMDYGRRPPAPKTAGDFAAMAGEATFKQLRAIWPKATAAETYHAIGITPMIGQNDGNQDAPFLVDDAVKVAGYAHEKGIGLLAYWSLYRDLAGKGDYNDHSNHQDQDFAFYKAFGTQFAQAAAKPNQPRAQAPAPAPAQAPGGQRLDLTKWTQEVHAARAFNNEEQRYQGGGANAAFKSDGTLIITAAKDAQGWSSARLHGDPLGPLPVYLEATITVPTGRGVWPAFWLTSTGSWPQGGEIDIMEQVNGDGSTHISSHWGQQTGVDWFKPTESIGGVDLSRPHRYGAWVAADGVQYYLDGKAVGAKQVFPPESNFPDIASKMVPIVNLAMGGNWPGAVPNDTGVQHMVVHQVIRSSRAP